MNEFLGMKVVKQYKDTVMDLIKLSYPYLSLEEISLAIDYSLVKRMRNGEAVIQNNYSHKTINTTVLDITEYILSREPIITTQGVMFKKHGECPNPLYDLLDAFINERVMYKKEMFKYPKGSDMFEKYNLLQLLAKLNANAIYGAMGQCSCVLYNIFVASSITAQGRSCISAAILLIESFLSNNVKFGSLNEIVTFINNVIHEPRKFKDEDVLDENITLEEAWFKIMSTCGFSYTPSYNDMQIIWEMMSRMSQEDLNRLYYKNNLYNFMDNSTMQNALLGLLQGLEKPFMDPNKPPKEIAEELEVFYELIFEYVYYGYQYIDRLERTENMIRNVSIITDTDSTIISLDAWYHYALDHVYDKPMRIKSMVMKPWEKIKYDEFGDPVEPFYVYEHIQPQYDYDFFTDEVIEKAKVESPWTICPQEGLKYSIINIMSHVVGKLCVDYMRRYTMNSHSYADNRTCLLVLKNEFYFSRVLNTMNKKNYADIQKLQEGNIVPPEAGLDVKGLPIRKSVLPPRTRKTLESILREKILEADEINQIDVLKALKIMEHDIYDSLMKGSKEYYKPVKIKSRTGYDDPMRQFGFKAAYAYNKLKEDGHDAIDLDIRNSIDIIKVNINKSTVEDIRYTNPELYDKMTSLMAEEYFKGEINSIALPINEPVPQWILQFIDFNAIVSDNVTPFPLESIGLMRSGKSNINSTNILTL
ncbi:MAG: hypothetical protein J6Y02_10135 [Pseudobutyrivibrio sp.]|nr:hypothetical protein [Pseudobutyrivibrio sp.]